MYNSVLKSHCLKKINKSDSNHYHIILEKGFENNVIMHWEKKEWYVLLWGKKKNNHNILRMKSESFENKVATFWGKYYNIMINK